MEFYGIFFILVPSNDNFCQIIHSIFCQRLPLGVTRVDYLHPSQPMPCMLLCHANPPNVLLDHFYAASLVF